MKERITGVWKFYFPKNHLCSISVVVNETGDIISSAAGVRIIIL